MPSMVRLMYQLKSVLKLRETMLKIAKLFYFCHLEKLIRPETFGPYHVPSFCFDLSSMFNFLLDS